VSLLCFSSADGKSLAEDDTFSAGAVLLAWNGRDIGGSAVPQGKEVEPIAMTVVSLAKGHMNVRDRPLVLPVNSHLGVLFVRGRVVSVSVTARGCGLNPCADTSLVAAAAAAAAATIICRRNSSGVATSPPSTWAST